MKALAVLGLLLGLLLIFQRPYEAAHEESAAQAVAMDFGLFRNAVFRFVQNNRSHSGEIPLSDLSLPESRRPLRDWKARVEGGVCYVYGEATPEEAEAARQIFQGSLSIGMAENGRLIPVLTTTPIPVPAFVPNGNLVSVTEMP